MNDKTCVEPLRLMFLSGIDTPLTILDIVDAIKLCKHLYISISKSSLYTQQDFVDMYKFTLHTHFNLNLNGIVANLQLRSIVATITNIVNYLNNNEGIDDTIFDNIIEMIPQICHNDTQSTSDEPKKQQIKRCLSRVAPLYNMDDVTSINRTNVDQFFDVIANE